MSLAQAVAGPDRLPWLHDEPQPARSRRRANRLAPAAAAILLALAGISYWIGAHSWQTPEPQPAPPTSTVRLPQPHQALPPQPQVLTPLPPEVSPSPQRELPLSIPRAQKRDARVRTVSRSTQRTASAEPKENATTAAHTSAAKPAQRSPAIAEKPLSVWPAWQSQGAYGRIVRIGAFGSRLQAKLGWRYMVQAYPAVAHLSAIVVETRNSRGHSFYRFQIGTTSQAHSEVLCQRMKPIRLSCAVVGLPWKPQGVER